MPNWTSIIILIMTIEELLFCYNRKADFWSVSFFSIIIMGGLSMGIGLYFFARNADGTPKKAARKNLHPAPRPLTRAESGGGGRVACHRSASYGERSDVKCSEVRQTEKTALAFQRRRFYVSAITYFSVPSPVKYFRRMWA